MKTTKRNFQRNLTFFISSLISQEITLKPEINQVFICATNFKALHLFVYNELNICVQVICDGAERSVHLGLRTLAASDLLLCISLLPHGLLGEERIAYPTKNFELIYRSYSGAVINTFILASTWLTVTMATSRYLAICRPFRMLRLVSMSGTKVTIVCVCLCCVVFNVPRFFEHDIETLTCGDEGRQIYVQNLGYLTQNHLASTVYAWIYFGFGIVCPLSTLAVCNIGLVRALRESSRVRQMYRVRANHVHANHRITTTLVTIIVTYIVLVSPAELLLFVQNQLPLTSRNEWLVVAVNVTNVLQTINFSFNFILYVVLNFHFRRTVADLICCWKRGWWPSMPRRGREPVHKVFLVRQMSMKTINTTL